MGLNKKFNLNYWNFIVVGIDEYNSLIYFYPFLHKAIANQEKKLCWIDVNNNIYACILALHSSFQIRLI
jgi:hypothetical protein